MALLPLVKSKENKLSEYTTKDNSFHAVVQMVALLLCSVASHTVTVLPRKVRKFLEQRLSYHYDPTVMDVILKKLYCKVMIENGFNHSKEPEKILLLVLNANV